MISCAFDLPLLDRLSTGIVGGSYLTLALLILLYRIFLEFLGWRNLHALSTQKAVLLALASLFAYLAPYVRLLREVCDDLGWLRT
jgi:hypothetical protein